MVWSRAAAVVTALVVLGATGCSGNETPSAGRTPGPSPTESAGTTTLPRPEPERAPRPPEARIGPLGQKAFARHVIDAWGYALRTNDAAPVLDLSPAKAPCQGCASLARELRKRKQQGFHVEFTGAKVKKLTVKVVDGVATAEATVSIPTSRTVNDDGLVLEENPAIRQAGFEVRMRYVKPSYRLVSFTVDAGRRR